MEEERNQETFTHVCKLCNKSYPSGKSLGGHMSSHAKAQNFTDINNEDEDEDDIEIDNRIGNVGNSRYGLRENPKKTWRIVDSYPRKYEVVVCRQCGKGFNSLKALYGHMSVHSADKYKYNPQFLEANNAAAASSNPNPSEIDQLELENVAAVCLMMLSRDCNVTDNCFDFAVESSDSHRGKKQKCDSQKVTRKFNADKKVKDYKCPFCPRVFKSGQAFGGHKRAHMFGSNNVSAASSSPEPQLKQPLFDLNLPALEDEEDQFVAW